MLAALFALNAVAVAAHAEGERASRLNLSLYGLSYHPDREGTSRDDLDNEFNLGIGLNYTLRENERRITYVEAGFFRDSGSRTAMMAGLGYQYKFGKRWRLGGALVSVLSPTYNDGRLALGLLPVVTYDFGRVKLNAMYAPRIGEYNKFAVFGLYFSLPFGP
ncbi:MAG TPA: hypothetical protein VFS80_13585 [Burkholderiales bacterium]|nr:hypothetical protein [Burkholderiales bacterium]